MFIFLLKQYLLKSYPKCLPLTSFLSVNLSFIVSEKFLNLTIIFIEELEMTINKPINEKGKEEVIHYFLLDYNSYECH